MKFCISPACKMWLGGLISAVSGAIVMTGTTMGLAPESFNFQVGLNKVLIVAGVSAILAVCNYLTRSPLPGMMRSPDGK